MARRFTKKSQSEIIAVILSLFVVASSALFVANGTMNGSSVSNAQFNNFIEKTATVDVFANTILSLDGNLTTSLAFDNGTEITQQEITFQLNDSNNSILKEKTNFEGYAEPDFDLYRIGPGSYSLSVAFQGSSALYLNPSYLEASIKITEDSNGNLSIHLIQIESQGSVLQELNETNFTIEANLTNQTLMNFTNETLNMTNFVCKEFNESVLWSSGFTLKQKGSTTYNTWEPNHTCSELNKTDCLLNNIEIQARFVYTSQDTGSEKKESYVKISEPGEFLCNNPEQGTYTKYLAFESLKESEKKQGMYCGKNKNPAAKCGVEIVDSYKSDGGCYGIKTYASQYSIVDVFEIKYSLCWEEP